MMLPAQPPPVLAAPAAPTPPSWIRKPALADVRAVYPPAAAAQGVGGTGVLACLVQADQTLTACQVAGETPPKTGFGKAALALVPLMRVQAPSRPGGPLPALAVPIRFDPPAPAAGAAPLMPRIAFTAAPDAQAVADAAPSGVAAKRREGLGVMRCTVASGALTACVTAVDDGLGFSRAALRLAPRFAVSTTFADGGATDGLILNVPVLFGGKAVGAVADPVWVDRPTPAQIAASFPLSARERDIAGVSVTLRCRIAADGGLEACTVRSETPAGVGGAQAAARLSRAYRVSVWDGQGRSSIGAAVDLTLMFGPRDAGTAAKP